MPIPTLPITCGTCGRGIAAEVVFADGYNPASLAASKDFPKQQLLWLKCSSCGSGSVRNPDGAVYPSAPAGRNISGLPADVESAWREGRVAHNVAAYTAAEMMFRKILMHVAVDKANATQVRPLLIMWTPWTRLATSRRG